MWCKIQAAPSVVVGEEGVVADSPACCLDSVEAHCRRDQVAVVLEGAEVAVDC